MLDFTLEAYGHILDGISEGGYRHMRVGDWFADRPANGPLVVLRHDVDRRPSNALAMARLEAQRGMCATYYFRILPVAFDSDIITQIAKLGHEIGYHYEDLHLARYDRGKAIELFQKHLSQLREIAPVRTIAMHGSPLAKYNNMALWDHFDYRQYGVEDCILSADYSDFVFFTDTGRSFAANSLNLRDSIGSRSDPTVSSSADVSRCLSERRHDKVQINVHPERWNAPGAPWLRQLFWDFSANSAKRVLRNVRRAAARTNL